MHQEAMVNFGIFKVENALAFLFFLIVGRIGKRTVNNIQMNTSGRSYEQVDVNSIEFKSSQINRSFIKNPWPQPHMAPINHIKTENEELQLLKQQLIYETQIYQRMLASHQKLLMQQRREAYVGCDSKGFVNYVENSVLCSTNHIKYSIQSEIGRGTYSRVFECKRVDANNNTTYAIKVIRKVQKYQKAAMHEMDILKHIKTNDTENTSCCIHIVDAGVYHGHPMFIFPLLSNALRSSISSHNPFTAKQATHLMWQMCRAIAFIHSLGIINTDVKPENVMFVSDESEWTDLNIKMIDFGAAIWDKHKGRKHHHMIQTRQYRTPEVLLSKGWSFEVDIWSLGCVLVELVCGKLLFPTHTDSDETHLRQIIECIGAPPNHVLDMAEDDRDEERNALQNYFVQTKNEESDSGDRETYTELHDLCAQMLCWNPKDRITAGKALQHPVFREYM
eukprot:877554_1